MAVSRDYAQTLRAGKVERWKKPGLVISDGGLGGN